MIETNLIVENDSDNVLYIMDETALRTESDNRRTWSPVGISPIVESNGSPQLNPQENIWTLLKNKIFTVGLKNSTEDLFEEVNHLYNQFNDNKELICNILNPRSYYFKSKL